ncbi:Gfo/Idh/MocA family oxidoreductase [Novosphingobium colocasiae]
MPANVAVVGLGKMGLSHLAVANALEHLKVVAICDSSEVVGRILQKYTQIPFIANYEKAPRLARAARRNHRDPDHRARLDGPQGDRQGPARLLRKSR